ncbi:MAG: polysaccharide biosynthesis protein [Lachnospiraceae bacterium]|nr:polysaccharide biosynthesis protein [Lachnospiraceae bacterium]
MKNIAIITGATGGIGREFVRQVSDLEIDEIWAVERLMSLRM